MGDLKLVERPQNYTLGPGAQQAIRRVRLLGISSPSEQLHRPCINFLPTAGKHSPASSAARGTICMCQVPASSDTFSDLVNQTCTIAGSRLLGGYTCMLCHICMLPFACAGDAEQSLRANKHHGVSLRTATITMFTAMRGCAGPTSRCRARRRAPSLATSCMRRPATRTAPW